jgi:hypothetical protein
MNESAYPNALDMLLDSAEATLTAVRRRDRHGPKAHR